jgi:hypothetical protein
MRGGSSLSRLCGAAAVAALVCAAPFARAAQAQPLRIDLPAQSLGSALRAFAQASNQQIIFSENAVRGKESRSLTGAYSLDDGLRRLLAGSGLAANRTTSGVIYVSPLPQAAPDIQAQTADQPVSELVVTGSRIRRADIETAAPVAMLDEDSLIERGYTNLGQLLNQVTSNVPQLPISASQGFPAGDGKTSPNLFNLGVGRTLTLVNGRRMVATSSGLGDRSVDAGALPFNLIKRVEIVQAGGAAVYGSDAIAGVVNYVLKDDYEGLELNAQYGIQFAQRQSEVRLQPALGTELRRRPRQHRRRPGIFQDAPPAGDRPSGHGGRGAHRTEPRQSQHDRRPAADPLRLERQALAVQPEWRCLRRALRIAGFTPAA